MRSLAVAVEDREDLGGAAVAEDPVRGHGVELGGLADLDEVLSFAEQEADGSLQHVEPVASGVDPRRGGDFLLLLPPAR